MKISEIEWMPSETDQSVGEEGLFAFVNGIEASVDRQEDGAWFWAVRPTGSRSESPELFDAGIACKSVAKRKAASALKRADRAYQTASQEGW